MIVLLSSCGGPDALLINIVHKDGSVTRKVILTYTKDEFDLTDCQVPVDSTWNITRSFDISEKGDTTYTLTAVKDFESVEEINSMYSEYEGPNNRMNRKALFDKKFRWFNTVYRYSENIEKVIDGIPPEDFFTPDELSFFFMPEKLVEARLEEEDSTQIKESILEPLEERTKEWLARSLINDLLIKIADTVRLNTDVAIDTSELLKVQDRIEATDFFWEMDEEESIDSLLGEGFYRRNKAVLESLVEEVENEFEVAFDAESYIVQTSMPGDLMDTNGYIDDEGNVIWEMDGEVILSADYEMWVESKTRNTWSWIVTGVFVLFVIGGLIIRVSRK
ncbi:MAG TPA: hypothetical protein DEQ09_06625 [Bacteroidales bacterium]|nr:hypothetical protein [Bacteroidales bacterium]